MIKNKKVKDENKKDKSISKISPKTNKFFNLKNIIKVFLILILVFGLNSNQNSFENRIILLAVSGEKDNLVGSTIDLNLEIKEKGSGKIFINLNSLEEIDTQISIINSQKIACKLFELDCSNYDFYYTFDGSALVLKGPSASSAIAILTVKTLKKESLKNNAVITGSLNSGGLIGEVGGVEEKIQAAQNLGFERVLIPQYSKFEENKTRKIEIIKVMDIIDAYNKYTNENYKLKTYDINKNEYSNIMKSLSQMLCDRNLDIRSKINFENIKENSSQFYLNEISKKTFNSSIIAHENKNYYSEGSFCFNSNINSRIIAEEQKNNSRKEINLELKNLRNEINNKYNEITSIEYQNNIKTINDFYVYLILNDRIEEAKKIINEVLTKEEINELNIPISNIIDYNSNKTYLDNSSINNKTNNIISNSQKINYYSRALERFYTVNVWENVISHSGETIDFNNRKITDTCFKINKQINIKSELLKNYNINIFDETIKEQNKLEFNNENKFYCVYKGIQIIGDMNSILNSVGIEKEVREEYSNKLNEFTKSRLSLNSNGNFPLIPFIYYEYSKDLISNNDFSTSIAYSNYALAYSDLNLYLEKNSKINEIKNNFIKELFKNNIFILGILAIIGFL